MKISISQTQNRALAFFFTSTFLAALLTTTSVRAGTIAVTNLPATGTDAATGLSSNGTYRCCIAWGATASVTVNGVVFTAEAPATGATSASGADFYGGSWSISAHVVTGNAGLQDVSGNETDANGNTEVLLSKLSALRGTPGLGSNIVLNFGGLSPGVQVRLASLLLSAVRRRHWHQSSACCCIQRRGDLNQSTTLER